MCVLESIFNFAFHLGPRYNSVSKKTIESLDTTQLKYEDLFWFAINFQCLGGVPRLPWQPSAIMKMSSRHLKKDFMRRSRITSCFRLNALPQWLKTESLISTRATNPMPDPCSPWKNLSPSISVLLTKWFRNKTKMILSTRFRSFAVQMEAAIFASYWCSPTTKKSLTSEVMSLSFGPSTNF